MNKYQATDPLTGVKSGLKTFKSSKGAAVAFQPKEKVHFTFFKNEEAAMANIREYGPLNPEGSLRLAQITTS